MFSAFLPCLAASLLAVRHEPLTESSTQHNVVHLGHAVISDTHCNTGYPLPCTHLKPLTVTGVSHFEEYGSGGRTKGQIIEYTGPLWSLHPHRLL